MIDPKKNVDLTAQFEKIRNTQKNYTVNSNYIKNRVVFSEKLGKPDLFSYMDHFGLYAGSQTIASHIVAYELVKQTVGVPGHILEFGTWYGRTLLMFAKVLKLLQPTTTKLVFGFDNFSGLPEPSELDGPKATSAVGRYKGSEEILRAAIELYELDDWVHLVVGDAIETIPAFAEAFPETLVSLAWIDFDLYEPCRAALEFLAKRISIGGVIVFDEAVNANWPGETIALLEFLESSESQFHMTANTLGSQPVMWLTRTA